MLFRFIWTGRFITTYSAILLIIVAFIEAQINFCFLSRSQLKHKKEKHARKSRRPQQQYIDNDQVADLEWNIPKVCKRNHMVEIREKWNDMIAHIFVEISLVFFIEIWPFFNDFHSLNFFFSKKYFLKEKNVIFNWKWPFFIKKWHFSVFSCQKFTNLYLQCHCNDSLNSISDPQKAETNGSRKPSMDTTVQVYAKSWVF